MTDLLLQDTTQVPYTFKGLKRSHVPEAVVPDRCKGSKSLGDQFLVSKCPSCPACLKTTAQQKGSCHWDFHHASACLIVLHARVLVRPHMVLKGISMSKSSFLCNNWQCKLLFSGHRRVCGMSLHEVPPTVVSVLCSFNFCRQASARVDAAWNCYTTLRVFQWWHKRDTQARGYSMGVSWISDLYCWVLRLSAAGEPQQFLIILVLIVSHCHNLTQLPQGFFLDFSPAGSSFAMQTTGWLWQSYTLWALAYTVIDKDR